MAPSIGQRATLGGKPVIWSGNHGWQSPASHQKLQEQGKFKVGAQILDRLWASAPQPVKDVSNEVQRRLANPIIGSKLEALPQQFRPTGPDATSRALKATSDKLNVDQRIVNAAANVAQSAIQGRLSANAARSASQVAAVRGATRLAADGPGFRMSVVPGGRTPKPLNNIDPRGNPYKGHTDAAGRTSYFQDPFSGTQRKPTGGPALTPEVQARAKAQWRREQALKAQDKLPRQIQPYQTTDATSISGVREVNPTQYGQPRGVGESLRKPLAKPQNPQPGPGNPRPQRVHIEGQPGPKRMEQGYRINPDRPDGQFPSDKELQVQGWTSPGNLDDLRTTSKANTAARNARRDAAVNRRLQQNTPQSQAASIREDVAWADGSLDKLRPIAARLGIDITKPTYRNASDLKRAIDKRLNTSGRTEKQTQALKSQYKDEWGWDNYSGKDKHEVNVLNREANRRFGQGSRGRRPITQQPAGNFKGAQVPPAIQQLLDDPLDAKGGRNARNRAMRPTEQVKTTPRSSKVSDEQITQNAVDNLERNRYQPKLSDAEREAARRARRGRPLRPASVRATQDKLRDTADSILKRMLGR